MKVFTKEDNYTTTQHRFTFGHIVKFKVITDYSPHHVGSKKLYVVCTNTQTI